MGLYAARDRYDYGARWYLRDFLDANNNTVNPSQQTIIIDSDADFAVQKIAYAYSYDGAAVDAYTRPIGKFYALIFDSTTGRYWSNEYVEIATIGGPAVLPFVLPTPKIMVAKSEITIKLLAASAPSTSDTQFSFVLNFIGTKLFRKAA